MSMGRDQMRELERVVSEIRRGVTGPEKSTLVHPEAEVPSRLTEAVT